MSHGLDLYELRRPNGNVLYRLLVPVNENFVLSPPMNPYGEMEMFVNGILSARGEWPCLKPVIRPRQTISV